MTEFRPLHPESSMMSLGYDPFLSEGAIKPPIFMTSTFAFRRAVDGERYFRWAYGLEQRDPAEAMGLIYSRLNNPGLEILEERLALWDGTERALSFASGMAAISTSVLAHCRPGDSVLYSSPVYGGTEYLMMHILPGFGIQTHSFAADTPAEELASFAASLGSSLRVLFLETPANPTNRMIDIEETIRTIKARVPEGHSLLTFVDNTFLGPVFQNPLRFGADLNLYSATKYIGGHSDVIAGAITGRGNILEPISVYRTILGSVPDPFSCWLLLRSLETLKIRMTEQAKNARILASRLQDDPRIEAVHYPELLPPGHPQRLIYEKQCSGPGAIVAFEIRGGKAAAFKFLDGVRLCKLAVSLGGTESLVEHPATMTHSDVPTDIQFSVGITEGLLRLSVGIEHVEDLWADLDQALARAVDETAVTR